MLVNGKWEAEWQPVQGTDQQGRFVRQTSMFRDWITPDGRPGPEGQSALQAEAGRYHLIVAYICPWASRALMARALKGLAQVISISVVDPRLSDQGWTFGDFPGSNPSDELIGASYMHDFYTQSDPHVSGRATVPVLWDKKTNRIVNNESADILRILNSGFGTLADTSVDLYPEALRAKIVALNSELYDTLNNGVYKAGFASSQFAYNEANDQIFAMLDHLEERLSDGRQFLLGNVITEPDIRAFVTLIRFDAAYVGLFKTNRYRIVDYPNLQQFLKTVLDIPGIRETVRMDHIKAGYYSIKSLNPNGIVPTGPDLSGLGF
ncbi:glutathione-dependent reductase [Amylibacter marinus]|uniref:Glutathione-dependent reductase n=1 Tax=Amylibacter marinus TaxID=1475483 RepID=A0ABQ5VSX4_9RHOB|nr:glutathione S-transferase family protein [Amylibacter marinus]GLQ34247.1 glutathione-dependent reductase [Amylibacter marinus]